MFMHNGFIGNWNGLRRHVEALIPDELYPLRSGTTDSEAIFLAMMGQGVDSDPLGATSRTFGMLSQLVSRNGATDKLRITAALANGRDLYAFRYAVNDAANTLYYRQSRHGALIVSEPLDDNPAEWTEVPPDHAVVARAGQPVEIVPFHPAQALAAE